MKNNLRLQWSLVISGVLLFLLGILLGIVGAEVLGIPFVRMDLVPFAIGFCGFLLTVVAGISIWEEKSKTKEQEIEEKDERNIKIRQNAKSKAFDLMTVLLSFGLLTLALFGYMNKISFFSLISVFFICQIYFGYQYLVNTNKM